MKDILNYIEGMRQVLAVEVHLRQEKLDALPVERDDHEEWLALCYHDTIQKTYGKLDILEDLLRKFAPERVPQTGFPS